MFVYQRTEPNLWTVGHYAPAGNFVGESDHNTPDAAADRCAYLNGKGCAPPSFIRADSLIDGLPPFGETGIQSPAPLPFDVSAVVRAMLDEMPDRLSVFDQAVLAVVPALIARGCIENCVSDARTIAIEFMRRRAEDNLTAAERAELLADSAQSSKCPECSTELVPAAYVSNDGSMGSRQVCTNCGWLAGGFVETRQPDSAAGGG